MKIAVTLSPIFKVGGLAAPGNIWKRGEERTRRVGDSGGGLLAAGLTVSLFADGGGVRACWFLYGALIWVPNCGGLGGEVGRPALGADGDRLGIS